MFFSLCCRINYELMEGNVIDLPSSILERLTNEEKDFPYFFRFITEQGIVAYVGVREFTSEHDEFVISCALAESLCLNENQIVDFELLENVLKGKFLKLEPLEKKFFEIPDYENILEEKLSKYPILSQNELITMTIFDETFTFKVVNVEHDWEGVDIEEGKFELDCVNIINTDVEVDVYNRFLEEEYYERLKKAEEEREREEVERSLMNCEDVNILKMGHRLGGRSMTSMTNEDIRRARLEKLKGK